MSPIKLQQLGRSKKVWNSKQIQTSQLLVCCHLLTALVMKQLASWETLYLSNISKASCQLSLQTPCTDVGYMQDGFFPKKPNLVTMPQYLAQQKHNEYQLQICCVMLQSEFPITWKVSSRPSTKMWGKITSSFFFNLFAWFLLLTM